LLLLLLVFVYTLIILLVEIISPARRYIAIRSPPPTIIMSNLSLFLFLSSWKKLSINFVLAYCDFIDCPSVRVRCFTFIFALPNYFLPPPNSKLIGDWGGE
jgi:hypothetical protein